MEYFLWILTFVGISDDGFVNQGVEDPFFDEQNLTKYNHQKPSTDSSKSFIIFAMWKSAELKKI